MGVTLAAHARTQAEASAAIRNAAMQRASSAEEIATLRGLDDETWKIGLRYKLSHALSHEFDKIHDNVEGALFYDESTQSLKLVCRIVGVKIPRNHEPIPDEYVWLIASSIACGAYDDNLWNIPLSDWIAATDVPFVVSFLDGSRDDLEIKHVVYTPSYVLSWCKH